MRRCMGCMAELSEKERVCKYCGYKEGTGVAESYYLLPGTVLGGKYMVGKVLGYGGFGITYIGWDNVLQRKVAIKEYLPSDFATRSYGTKKLTVFTGKAEEQFEAGLRSFISEAKRLAKFNSVREIVDIYDSFEENGSGYIVMEYLEGVTVKNMLEGKGRIPVKEAREIVLSVLRGLAAVHKENIIHRDIAPDNIFITDTGEVKILDFGAARYATTVQSKSLSVILKPGYAPEEQYRSHGEQGPWTDMYALGATFYRMITGIRPDVSIERMSEDHLKPPSELGVDITPNIENAIMNSLNIQQENRIQDAESFYHALTCEEQVGRIVEKKTDSGKWFLPIWMKCAGAVAVMLIFTCIALFATGRIGYSKKQIASAGGVAALGSNECYVPNVLGMSYEETEKVLKQKNLSVVINGMNYSNSIEKNKILSQNPDAGMKAGKGDTIYVTMSGGREEVMMPDLSGMEYQEAKAFIEAQNLVLPKDAVTEEYSDLVEKGRVISQNIDPEKRISVQTEVFLTVSLGRLSEETAVLEVPDLKGLTKEKALRQLEKLKKETGFTYPVGQIISKHHGTVEKGKIISQSLKAGASVRTSEPINLVISKGPQMAQVPDVVYMEQEKAEKKLEGRGFRVQVNGAYSSAISEGLVISQSEEKNASLAKGSTVTLTVSLGEQPAPQNNGGGSSTSGNSSTSGDSGGSSTGGTSSGGNAGSASSGGSTGSISGGNNAGGSSGGSTGGNNNAASTSGGNGAGSIGGSNHTGNTGGGSTGGDSSETSGEKVLMPDGGSFIVE